MQNFERLMASSGHLRQVLHRKVLRRAYRSDEPKPDESEINAAQQLVDAFKAHQQAGVGAFVFDGKMIDEAIVRPAWQILAKARAAGKAPSPSPNNRAAACFSIGHQTHFAGTDFFSSMERRKKRTQVSHH